jgi:RNA:NAD 2'-phosphotransferase (TPT1/KptA family)
MCVIAAYGVQCFVAGCRGSGAEQQAVRPERGMLYDCSRAASLFLDSQPAALNLTPDNQQKALHTIAGNNTHIMSSS